jgi:transcriptional regulator with XRE-family HTH domain
MNRKQQVESASKAILSSGLSDKEIAERMGTTIQTVNRWRRKAVKSIRPINIRLLAEALKGNFFFLEDGSVKFHYGEAITGKELPLPSKEVVQNLIRQTIPSNYDLNEIEDEGLSLLLRTFHRYGNKITPDETAILILLSLHLETNTSDNQWASLLYALRSLN